jgi:hypothetical protein
MFAVLSVAAILWHAHSNPGDEFTGMALAVVTGLVLGAATVTGVKRVLKGGRK